MGNLQLIKVREQIPALSRMNYLDNAGAGLPPLSVTDAMKSLIEDWSHTGEHWQEWLLEVVQCRRLFGKLIGAEAEEIGVVPSVSVGLASLACSIDLSKRKKVVTSSLNFPTNIILWQRMREQGLLKSVEVLRHRRGIVPLEAWERAIDDETALVAVDYVSWLSGYRESVREISEIAHSHNALLVADGFHALNVFPVDVRRDGIDALVCGFYKWLCGPHGVACVYADKDILHNLRPMYIGWHGVKDNVIERIQRNRDPFDIPFPHDRATPSPTAARFEWGTWAIVAVRGALESVKFALRTDIPSHFRAIADLRDELIEGLRRIGIRTLASEEDANHCGGIVTFGAKDYASLVRRLYSKRIVVSGRFGYLRISPHYYNTPGEVDMFLRELKNNQR